MVVYFGKLVLSITIIIMIGIVGSERQRKDSFRGLDSDDVVVVMTGSCSLSVSLAVVTPTENR